MVSCDSRGLAGLKDGDMARGGAWRISVLQVACDVSQKSPAVTMLGARTKTDTGRRGEDPKALERTLLKELGKITP